MEKIKRVNWVRMNLQTFADKEQADEKIDETNSSDGTENTAEEKKVDNKIPYERFKAKVDEANALKEKLAEIEKSQEEAKRKELEEQNEYKTLYEQALEQAQQAKSEAIEVKKNALLVQAGYSEDQTKLLSKLVEGETDEDILESIKLLKSTIPVKEEYGDPSAFNGVKTKPETVGADELGAKVFERIKNKIF